MLGWTVELTRPAVPVFSFDDPRLHPRRSEFGAYPYMPDDLRGQRVARWFAELGGIAWLMQAERPDGVGVAIRCTGYPSIYAVPVDQVPPVVDREHGRANTVGSEPADLSAVAVVPRREWLMPRYGTNRDISQAVAAGANLTRPTSAEVHVPDVARVGGAITRWCLTRLNYEPARGL